MPIVFAAAGAGLFVGIGRRICVRDGPGEGAGVEAGAGGLEVAGAGGACSRSGAISIGAAFSRADETPPSGFDRHRLHAAAPASARTTASDATTARALMAGSTAFEDGGAL
jgi:hypothetical protein